MSIVWIIVLVASILMYGLLTAYVLPRTFLKTEFASVSSRDRGLKNIKETVGRSIVYQPSKKNRKYIPQYVISDRKGKKVLVCKTAPNVRFIDYDVVMFNGINKAFNVINSKELIERGFTERLELDENTAYVSLIINKVNGERFKTKVVKPIPGGRIALYAASCGLLTIVEVFLMKLCCSYGFGGVFREGFMLSLSGTLFTASVAAVAALINVAIILIVVLRGNRKETAKGER